MCLTYNVPAQARGIGCYRGEKRIEKGKIGVIKIFFDMDGVLADFNKGVEELCGFEGSDRDRWKASGNDDEMWVGIREVVHFYDKLDPMPGAIEMFERIYGKYPDHCGILTGIPKPKRGILTAGEDKTTWVRRLLSEDIPVNIVIREEKPDLMNCVSTEE